MLLPNMGICEHVWQNVPESRRAKFAPYCRVANVGTKCKVYHNCILIIGFLIPILSVIACYILIVICLIQFKKSEKILKKEKDFVVSPGSLREKIRMLKEVGCEAIPYSIPTLLLLHICSLLPWLLVVRYPESMRTDKMLGYVGKFTYNLHLLMFLVRCSNDTLANTVYSECIVYTTHYTIHY